MREERNSQHKCMCVGETVDIVSTERLIDEVVFGLLWMSLSDSIEVIDCP